MPHTKARKFKPQAKLKPMLQHWWQARKADVLASIPRVNSDMTKADCGHCRWRSHYSASSKGHATPCTQRCRALRTRWGPWPAGRNCCRQWGSGSNLPLLVFLLRCSSPSQILQIVWHRPLPVFRLCLVCAEMDSNEIFIVHWNASEIVFRLTWYHLCTADLFILHWISDWIMTTSFLSITRECVLKCKTVIRAYVMKVLYSCSF